MSNISLELDCAKAILKTYHQVHDTPYNNSSSNNNNHQNKKALPKHPPKNREVELENEVNQLKEQYKSLLHELSNRDERLIRLDRQLQDRTSHMARLQEDYENAIYQLTRREKP